MIADLRKHFIAAFVTLVFAWSLAVPVPASAAVSHFADTVQMSIASAPGTSTITLGSATSGHQSFSAASAPDGLQISYFVQDVSGAWEIDVGTYNSSAGPLTRGLQSSSTGSLLSLTSNAIVSLEIISADLNQFVTAGFVNVLRNASLTSWFHGTSGTATTTAANTNWTAEGVFVIPTGASITWVRTTTCPTGNLTYYCDKITGASSVTDVKIRFVIDSLTAAKIAGQTVTSQFTWLNNSGSSISPAWAGAYPTTQDGGVTSGAGWSADTADQSGTLAACSNGSSCTEGVTFNVSASATMGYEVVIDFGNNFGAGGDTFALGGGFDLRVAPAAQSGAPLTTEINDKPPRLVAKGASKAPPPPVFDS